MKEFLKRILRWFGFITIGEFNSINNELNIWKTGFFPPGHYYSPLNNITDLNENDDIFNYNTNIKDINLNFDAQKLLLEKLRCFYNQLPFTRTKSGNFRYYLDNNFYSFSDGIFLYCMINHLKPAKIIEIGSGFSSALMMDTNNLNFSDNIDLTFIEPFPEERLFKLISGSYKATIIKDFVQQVDLASFSLLEVNDILFVDSSHVSKFNSDLNHIMFNILPVLQKGVYIHFHDFFFPFEYPKEWIISGRAWNEMYLIRAFLMNNSNYEIVLFPSMMENYYTDWLQQNMPLTMELHEKWPNEEKFEYYLSNKGQSLWLKKI